MNALLTDLRSVIEGPSIYQTVVHDIKLSDATLKVQTEIVKLQAVRNPTEEQLAQLTQLRRRLNRSLLDDTYAKELYPQSAWAPHSVSLVIDPRTPGLASAVDKQKLVENGKRGFPYRIAALTTKRYGRRGRSTTLRDSETAKLERDTKLLELKKKKIDAEKALKDAAKEEPSPTPEP